MDAYRRAIDLFIAYLGDRQFEPSIPAQRQQLPTAEQIAVQSLTPADEYCLCHFAQWLQTPCETDKRPYAMATIELRVAGLRRWFEFINEQGWFADDFSVTHCFELLKAKLQAETTEKATKAVIIDQDLSDLLSFYDQQKPSEQVKRNPERLERWQLTRLRNEALVRILAETGGQVSAILNLNIEDVITDQSSLVIDVTGKNEHAYRIILDESLPSLQDYLVRRNLSDGKAPVFISHDAKYDGNRMSRIIAWRVIQRAARGMGLETVSPHDLRHWRAQKMIEAGADLEEVKERLGHRSLHTVKTYYGHLIEGEEDEE